MTVDRVRESAGNQTNRLSDIEIAVYALYSLGGWQRRVHTEDIARECFRMAPSRFSWVKYPEYPDPTPVRHALEHAKNRSDSAPLVQGASERTRSPRTTGGWTLTEDGARWMAENKARIAKLLGRRQPVGGRLPAERKIRELRLSKAFRLFAEQGDSAEVSEAAFAESLVCTVNTPPAVLRERLGQLTAIANELQQEDVKNYVDFCRRRFTQVLETGGDSRDR